MNKKAFIPISALMGALLLALVAAMTPFVAEPDIAYAQSADATLSALAIVGEPGDVNANLARADGSAGGFDSAVEDYKARIPFITGGVTVTATATDTTNATVTFSHSDTDTSEDGQQINLASRYGMTTDIVVTVRAQAGNTKRYTISVYRERETLNDDANLSSLSISPSGGLKESSTSTSAAPMYEARVQSGKVTVSYNLSDSAGGASAVVAPGSGTTIDDTTKPREITLTAEGAVGTFTVTVTPESGTGDNKVYTIRVYRIRANRAIDADLSTLTLTPIPSTPALVNDIDLSAEDFVARAANATTHVTVVANTMDIGAVRVISPADADGNEDGHQVSLTAGAVTTITVNVTAEDPSSRKTYTVKVYRNRSTLSTEARLSSLSLSDGRLDPSFSRTTNSYDVRVGHDVGEITVSCATVDTAGAASVAVATTPAQTDTTKNECGEEFELADAGATTTITVTVTAEDASTTNAYTITVYRVRSLPSADATLSALTLTPIPASPALEDGIALADGDFSARAVNDTTHVTVAATAMAAANGAEFDISPADAVPDDGDDTTTDDAGHQVALTAGMITTITVTVTAEDGTTTKAYMVEVYRERLDESEDATLSALSLSDGMLDPAFMSDRMEYDARVGSDVSEITVSSTTTDDKGGVSVAVTATDGTTACDGSATACDVDGMKVTLGGPGSETIISVAVTPEAGAGTDNANIETYMITVYRERRNLETINTLAEFRIIDANPSGDTYTGVIAPTGTVDHDGDGGTTPERNYWDLTGNNADRDVGYRVRTVIVSANPSDSAGGAVARITAPPDKDSTTAAHEIDLTAGAETTITVEVMAEDPNAPTRTYTANVYRQGLTLDDDATLSSLMLSGVDLMYMDDNDMEMTGFMSDVMEYTADAPYSTMQTTVTAMATHIGAQSSIEVGTLDDADPPVFTEGSDANADLDGWQVDLTAGQNEPIVVQVMSEDGTETEHYIITVTRAAAASDNAKLKSLTLMHGGEEVSLLTAKYWWNTLDCPQMQAVVGDGDMEGDMATYCVMYDDLSAAGKMRVDEVFAMSVEDAWNMIGCELMKQAVKMDDQAFCAMYDGLGESEMDTVYEVYRPTSFSVMVGGGVDMTNITAEPAHAGAMVSGDTGMQNLMVGENDFTVSVTAEDEETMMAYMVKVTRAALTDTERLLARYDGDGDGEINDTELGNAIFDNTVNETLSDEDLGRVIFLWAQS